MAFEEIKEHEPELAVEVFDFDSSDRLVNLLIIFTISMIILLVGTLIYVITQEGRSQTARLRSTGKPQVLTLRKGHRYHLFNSREP